MSAMRRRRAIQRLARKLAEQVHTVEAICALQRTKLEAIDENGGMVTDNEARDIQSELEDAERLRSPRKMSPIFEPLSDLKP